MRNAGRKIQDSFIQGMMEAGCPMKKGVTELLSYLKEKGWIVGLASSTKEATVTQEIRDAGLMPYFDNLTCGDMLKKSKPEPDIFLMACEKLAVKPQEAIIIEDSHNGIRQQAVPVQCL